MIAERGVHTDTRRFQPLGARHLAGHVVTYVTCGNEAVLLTEALSNDVCDQSFGKNINDPLQYLAVNSRDEMLS